MVKRAYIAVGLLAGLLTACGDTAQDPLAPDAPALASSGPTLIECPTNTTRSTSAVIGLFGGTVELGDHSITLPFGAVLLPTRITITEPASSYMEVEIRANDLESFDFLKPVGITISYDRCTRSDLNRSQLTIWQIDPDTKELLEHMGGLDDKLDRIVTFGSEHLSGFAIAN